MEIIPERNWNSKMSSNSCIASAYIPLRSTNIIQTDGMNSLVVKAVILADAILDRIMHNFYRIHIQSADPAKDVSMCEV